jgi:two-component system OmpR family response regulator
MARSVLVVDDDASIRDGIAELLEMHGYQVGVADSASSCEAELARASFDLIILDVMMPGEDGLSLCRRIAPMGRPIMMLSALDAVTDRIVGLEVGAWDYLAKPFEPRELLARVRALLRRPDPAERSGLIEFAGWRLDMDQRRLSAPSGARVLLSEGEHALLAAFIKRPGKVLTRDALLDLTRGHEADTYDRAVDIAISRLRRKLADAHPSVLIETVRGVGYRFAPKVRSA